MSKRRLQTLAALVGIAGVSFLAYQLMTLRMNDETRLRQLIRAGSILGRLNSGKVTVSDQIAKIGALVHFTKPTVYYQRQYEAHKKALMESGYLVEVTVLIPNLRAKVPQIVPRVDKSRKETGAFFGATFDYSRDRVIVLCRKRDFAFWESLLKRDAE
jgi:hypothetical protein